MGRVQDKIAIVTGGASNPGLGRATAITLGAQGARVVVTDIDEAGAESYAAAIREAGGDAFALHQDVTSEAVWRAVIAQHRRCVRRDRCPCQQRRHRGAHAHRRNDAGRLEPSDRR